MNSMINYREVMEVGVNKRNILLGLMLSVVLAMPSVGFAQMQATVRVEKISEETIQDHQQVLGTFKATNQSDVTAREEGAVVELNIVEGTKVKKGDVMVVLDQRRLQAQLSQAKASLSTVQSLVEQREAELERSVSDFEMKERLFNDNAIAKKEYWDAQREQKVANAQWKSSKDRIEEIQSEIDFLKVRLSDTKILAPFDGWVIKKYVEVGEWLTPGKPVALLNSAGTIDGWLNVPERLVASLKEKMNEVTIYVEALDKKLVSKKIKMIPNVDERSRTFQVVVEVDNAEGLLSPGMSITAWIPTGTTQKHLVVSDDALIRNELGYFVYLAQKVEDGYMAKKTPVRLLFTTGNKSIIESSALKVDDLVVIEGNERLFPDTSLVISKAGGE